MARSNCFNPFEARNLYDINQTSYSHVQYYIHTIYFHLSPRKTSINPLNLAQMQKPMAVSESAGPDGSEAPPTF